MTFWSGDKLLKKLPNYITPFNKKHIDCASYRLSVGDQAYVTNKRSSDPCDIGIKNLDQKGHKFIKIPPGQFAFLLTEEVVNVPTDAIALISMRAKYKFQGLINVSGFHVDPGWYGKLIFSVYNAGPAEVLLPRGEPAFLIVYADLDQPSSGEMTYTGSSKGQKEISPELVARLQSEIFSTYKLSDKLDVHQERLNQLEGMKSQQKWLMGMASVAAAFLALILGTAPVMITFFPKYSAAFVATLLDDAGYKIERK